MIGTYEPLDRFSRLALVEDEVVERYDVLIVFFRSGESSGYGAERGRISPQFGNPFMPGGAVNDASPVPSAFIDQI